jgi:hypothetical protein
LAELQNWQCHFFDLTQQQQQHGDAKTEDGEKSHAQHCQVKSDSWKMPFRGKDRGKLAPNGQGSWAFNDVLFL